MRSLVLVLPAVALAGCGAHHAATDARRVHETATARDGAVARGSADGRADG